MQTIANFVKEKNQSWFKEWFDTNFYQQLYSNRSEKEASDFVDNLINYLKPGNSSTMLDLGCGTGRHARRLAAHGHCVTGLDLSPSGIRTAKKIHTPGTQFYQHDMRLPFCASRYQYIFSFFTSFGYFTTSEENDSVISNVSMALKSKGTFVMDYLNVGYAEEHMVQSESKEIDGVVYHISRWHDHTHFYKHIEVNDIHMHGVVHEYTEQVEKIRLNDFDILFRRHGLHLRNIYGDYKLNDYNTYSSPRLIMIAGKAGE
ncbi:MAG: class I SAM-dependent methyltransferase [Chitinophagaceae bacterium]|nr:class I SAM-dependent methyltransferase [Chitinophagaceae bacterium]